MNRREPMVRRQLYITNEQAEKMEKLSVRSGITASEHYRRAIDAYLESKAGRKV